MALDRQKFYVLIEPWAVYVKEAALFTAQGGTSKSWGKNWQGPIEAVSIEAARMWGRKQFPYQKRTW